MGDNAAVLDGYTREVHGTNIARDIYLLVKPHTDLAGDFRAWDMNGQEFIRVHGYQWLFTEVL